METLTEMKNLIILLVLFPIGGYSQSINDVLKTAQDQTVRICVKYDGTKNQNATSYGYGFILSGQYLATCYHILIPQDKKLKIKSIYIIINEHTDSSGFKYDSIFAVRNFKLKNGQYNFNKHIYDTTNHATDFIILKLLKKVPVKVLHIKKDTLKYGDSLYSLGGVDNYENGTHTLTSAFRTFIFGWFEREFGHNEVGYYRAFIGNAKEGFSGSLVYDEHSKIVGMVQFGRNSIPIDWLNNMHDKGIMNDDLYNKVIAAYHCDGRICYCIDINYLIKKYFKGYW